MKVGLLIIGSEILDGKVTDINTRFFAEFLRHNHNELFLTMTVKDEESTIHRALHTLFDLCDVVMTSGGLGPTKDDITKHTLASFLGRAVTYSEDAYEVAQENYLRMQRVYPGKDHGYSYLPIGFMALSNSSGFAPGFFTRHENKFLMSAPGVPREFRAIVEDHFTKLILSQFEQNFLHTVTIRTKKVPEEKIFNEVDPELWDRLEVFGSVSSLPKIFGVDITVNIKAKNQAELTQKKLSVLKIFDESPLKQNIWHIGTESIEQVILAVAESKKVHFGFAESATGGLCSHRITDIPGSSKHFTGSVICYDQRIKEEILDVKPETIKEFGVVSQETAQEMALGLAIKFDLDIAVSITGLAGPGGGTQACPVGSVCIGVYRNGSVSSYAHKFNGDRETLKLRFSQLALMTLLEEMEKIA